MFLGQQEYPARADRPFDKFIIEVADASVSGSLLNVERFSKSPLASY